MGIQFSYWHSGICTCDCHGNESKENLHLRSEEIQCGILSLIEHIYLIVEED